MKNKNVIKRIVLILVTILASLSLVACGSKNNSSTNSSNDSEKAKVNPTASIVIKDYGTIELELYPEIAPNTVNNFISLVNKGFYNGLTFHRVIKDFMIQGGDPNGDGTGGPGYCIKGEFSSNGFENNLKHTKGVISMARLAFPLDSAGSQFFIMTADIESLDGDYAAFGKVTSGLEILDKIQNVETNEEDKPLNHVVIEKITVDTKGVTYPEPETLEEVQ